MATHSRDDPTITTEQLMERALQQGLELDPERAERLRPKIESLLGRLARLGSSLPREAEPPPAGALPASGADQP